MYETEFVIWAPWLGLVGQFGVHEFLVLFILTRIYIAASGGQFSRTLGMGAIQNEKYSE